MSSMVDAYWGRPTMSSLLVVSVLVMIAHLGQGEATASNVAPYKFHSFKVQVLAGKRDCFYQMVERNSTMSIMWRVMSVGTGGEFAASVSFRQTSTDKILYDSEWTQYGYYHKEGHDKDLYEVCLDNRPSYVSKTIFLWVDYLQTADWSSLVAGDDEVNKGHIKQDVLAASLQSIELRIGEMKYYQAISHEQAGADEASIVDLNDVVLGRSVFSCTVILVTAVFQVYFLKHLFNVSPSKINNKT